MCLIISVRAGSVMTSWWSSAQDSKLIVQTFAPYFLRTTPTLPKQLNSKELQIAIDVRNESVGPNATIMVINIPSVTILGIRYTRYTLRKYIC